MRYQNRKEKRKMVAEAVNLYVKSGMNKTAAVKRVSNEFGYLTEIPVWNALKKEKEEQENGNSNS